MGKKKEIFGIIEDTILHRIYHFDISLFFRYYIYGLNKKSRHDYRLTRAMKKDYIAYYRSFGFKHVHTDWLEYVYGITGQYDRRIIPDDIFTKYIDYPFAVNRIAWVNKAYQPDILKGVRFPQTVVKRVNGYFLNSDNEILSLKDALTCIRKEEEVVVKPSIGSSGIDIHFYKSEDISEDLFEKFPKDIVIQKVIRQSEFMKKFNDDSVKILKITSFLFHDEVHILCARIWGGKSENRVSNSNTYIVPVNPDGSLKECGFNYFGERFYKTEDGTKFSDLKIDFYDECIRIIQYGHTRLLNFPFISWDFTQDENGNVILIEYNLKWHVLYDIQMLSGPAFGDFTDEVLEEAAQNIHKIKTIDF